VCEKKRSRGALFDLVYRLADRSPENQAVKRREVGGGDRAVTVHVAVNYALRSDNAGVLNVRRGEREARTFFSFFIMVSLLFRCVGMEPRFDRGSAPSIKYHKPAALIYRFTEYNPSF
jgi:hypothetical protein